MENAPVNRPPFWQVTGYALRLRCPRCGEGRLYRTWLELEPHCPVCGFEVSHEHGFFIGSIYLNYGATALVLFPVYYLMRTRTDWTLPVMIAVLLGIGALVPPVATRWSRSLWLAWDYYLGPHREPGD